jgi:hypothetical protein
VFQLFINDERPPGGFLAFNLRDVLRALGPDALHWMWSVSGVAAEGEPLMATGEGASDLEALVASGERVSGSRLLEMAGRTHQVIWGEFRSYRHSSESEPWVKIIAFDSSWYEVWSEDEATVQRVASVFNDTTLTPTPIP